MRRLAAASAALAAVAASALVGLVGAAPSAAAAPVGQCTTTSGAIIAVDYGHWGGPIVRGCGIGEPTGYALLHAGGFTTTGDQHDGPAFICRIGSASFHGGTAYPTTADESCVLTPPASAYWSYWIAPAGQNTWSYSQLGAMSEVPTKGEVELWSFGGTNIAGTSGSGMPRVTPAQIRATNTTAAGGSGSGGGTSGSVGSGTGRSPGRVPAGSGTSHSGGSQAGSRGAPSVAPSASTAATTSPTPGASRSAGVASPSPSQSSGPAIVDASAAASTGRAATGSAVPLVIALVVVLLLAGGAGVTVLRRRRSD